MRNALAYIMVVHVLLTSLTPAGVVEVFRIPALSDHYAQHVQESAGTMSWADFLLLHYLDPGHEKSDGKRHAHLPFHRTVDIVAVFTLAVPPVLALERDEAAPAYGHVPAPSCALMSGSMVFHPPKGMC